MKLFLFALLLSACLLNLTPAGAIPARARRQLQSNSGMVTMPLKRLDTPRGVDLHPQVVSSPCPTCLILRHHDLFDGLTAPTTTYQPWFQASRPYDRARAAIRARPPLRIAQEAVYAGEWARVTFWSSCSCSKLQL